MIGSAALVEEVRAVDIPACGDMNKRTGTKLGRGREKRSVRREICGI